MEKEEIMTTGADRPSFFLRGEDIQIRTERITVNEITVAGRFAGMMTITRFK